MTDFAYSTRVHPPDEPIVGLTPADKAAAYEYCRLAERVYRLDGDFEAADYYRQHADAWIGAIGRGDMPLRCEGPGVEALLGFGVPRCGGAP